MMKLDHSNYITIKVKLTFYPRCWRDLVTKEKGKRKNKMWAPVLKTYRLSKPECTERAQARASSIQKAQQGLAWR